MHRHRLRPMIYKNGNKPYNALKLYKTTYLPKKHLHLERWCRFLTAAITAGANYAHQINKTFSIYGEVAGGLNLSNFTGLKFSGNNVSDEVKWEMGTGFTYGLRAGVLFNRKYIIEVGYSNLGSYKYKGKWVYEYGGEVEKEDIEFDKKLPISGIFVTVGILF